MDNIIRTCVAEVRRERVKQVECRDAQWEVYQHQQRSLCQCMEVAKLRNVNGVRSKQKQAMPAHYTWSVNDVYLVSLLDCAQRVAARIIEMSSPPYRGPVCPADRR